jgi:hypothetical protein
MTMMTMMVMIGGLECRRVTQGWRAERFDYIEMPTIAATTAPKKAPDAALTLTELAAFRLVLELLLELTMVVVPFDICVPAKPIAPEVALRFANPTLAGSERKTVYTFLRNESPTTQVGWFELLWPGMGDELEPSSRMKNAARQKLFET